MNRDRPGMNDVAREAGVSHQTVSRVLNDHPNVRPATRDRVLTAIATLGYRRNSAARALVTRRSGVIGVVASGSLEFGPTTTLAVLEQVARSSGYVVSVATAAEATPQAMEQAFDSLVGQFVEGIVVIAPHEQVAQAARAVAAQVPVLMLAAMDPQPGDHGVVHMDQRQGTALVVQHLLELGHRDVVHVSGPMDWFDAKSRREAWHSELAAAGVQPRPDNAGDWTAESGYRAGQLLSADPPSAVFAANDHTALGLLHAFASAGVRVPEQVSVVGYDDVPGSDHFLPPLTTVRQDFEALGRHAMEVLIGRITGTPVPAVPISPELLIRESTASAG